MTDDIVERLNSSYAMLGDPLHKEAADEIERLKNQISHIIEHNNPQIENANSYFKSLEEELARCNKIIDDYEEEHSKLREKLLQIGDLFSEALQSDCENGVRSLNEKAYANYLKEYPATLVAIQNMNDIIDAALAGEKTNDV